MKFVFYVDVEVIKTSFLSYVLINIIHVLHIVTVLKRKGGNLTLVDQ